MSYELINDERRKISSEKQRKHEILIRNQQIEEVRI